MVFKSSILVGAKLEDFTAGLLARNLISNWQNLAPTMANTVRILIIVEGDDQDYNNALNAVIAAAAAEQIAWQHDSILKFGNPMTDTWQPPLAIPSAYVKAAA